MGTKCTHRVHRLTLHERSITVPGAVQAMHPWGPQQEDTAERFLNLETQNQGIIQNQRAKGFRRNINPRILTNCHGQKGVKTSEKTMVENLPSQIKTINLQNKEA